MQAHCYYKCGHLTHDRGSPARQAAIKIDMQPVGIRQQNVNPALDLRSCAGSPLGLPGLMHRLLLLSGVIGFMSHLREVSRSV